MKIFHPQSENIESVNPFHPLLKYIDSYFLREKEWQPVSDVRDADVIPIEFYSRYISWDNPDPIPNIGKNQILLVWPIEVFESIVPSLCREAAIHSPFYKKHDKILFVHTNLLDNDDPKFISYDLMFNRHKLYHTEYDAELCGSDKLWTWYAPKITYELGPIEKTLAITNKIFLCPLRIRDDQNTVHNNLKYKLKVFLHSINANMYINDPYNNNYFLPNGWGEKELSNRDLMDGMKRGGWYPIDIKYYNTSYIALAIETNYGGEANFGNDILYITEKSFDPLIKGNFPLIMGSHHTIKRLKEVYGFKFPDWIDYTYDNLVDLDKRFEAYCNSIKEISMVPVEKIHELYIKDRHILEYNRNIFYQRPYDNLYSKIMNSLQVLKWLD